MPKKAKIFFIGKNFRGAYVVYGSEGVKQYYGCTKEQAQKQYQLSGKTFMNSWKKTIYWLAAAVLNAAVTF